MGFTVENLQERADVPAQGLGFKVVAAVALRVLKCTRGGGEGGGGKDACWGHTFDKDTLLHHGVTVVQRSKGNQVEEESHGTRARATGPRLHVTEFACGGRRGGGAGEGAGFFEGLVYYPDLNLRGVR
jgi:hypothetical protein